MSLFGDKGTQANANELYALARQAGFSVQDAVTATAIALAESSGTTNAWHNNRVQGGEDSYGPWQINIGWDHSMISRGTPDELVNPQKNAAAALAVAGAGADKNWCAWSVFDASCGPGHTGAYRSYLPQARQAVNSVPDDQIHSIVGQLMERAQQTFTPGAAGSASAPGQPGLPTGQSDAGPAPDLPGLPSLPGLPDIGGGLAGLGAAIARPFVWASVPGHWWAVGLVLVGIFAVVAGGVIYFRPELEDAAGQVAKVAATAA